MPSAAFLLSSAALMIFEIQVFVWLSLSTGDTIFTAYHWSLMAADYGLSIAYQSRFIACVPLWPLAAVLCVISAVIAIKKSRRRKPHKRQMFSVVIPGLVRPARKPWKRKPWDRRRVW